MTKNDYTTIFLVTLGALAAGSGWISNIWGRGSERTYERMVKSGHSWPVLRALRIEPTRDTCIRFLRCASAVGLFVAIPLVALTITAFLRHR